jgi:hypothetical protein
MGNVIGYPRIVQTAAATSAETRNLSVYPKFANSIGTTGEFVTNASLPIKCKGISPATI